MRFDDNPFHFSVLPFPSKLRPPSPATQQAVLDDISRQLIVFLSLAKKDKRNPFRALSILANCERVLDVYTSAGYDQLSEFKHALQTDLRTALRMARRYFIRQVLLSSKEELPDIMEEFYATGWKYRGEALKDYKIVEAHIDYGMDLFADLHKRQRRNGMA
jgi:hypothetical protein